MPPNTSKPLRIVEYDAAWQAKFGAIGSQLRHELGSAALRIDHIGSTAVPGLPAKDLIDIQITIERLADADEWPNGLLSGSLQRRAGDLDDHVPPLGSKVRADWEKRYWSDRQRVHVHVRQAGRANQRYALLFRDFLRADPIAASAYGQLKAALALAVPDDWETYYAVKSPLVT